MALFGKKRKEEIQEIKQAIQLPTLEKIMAGIEKPVEQKPVQKLEEKLSEIPEEKPFIIKPNVERLAQRMPEHKLPEMPNEEIQEKMSFAPLFVKLDRYKQILNTMNYLKNTMNMIKNTFSILNELEKIRMENLRLVQETIEKADKKILTLDSEFMRPSGFIEDRPEIGDVESLEVTLVDLRDQVNQLKAELKSMT